MDPGARVEFVGDTKQSTLAHGMRGTVQRVGRRGVDVRFDGRDSVTTGVARAALRVLATTKALTLAAFAREHGVDPLDVVVLARTAIDLDNAAVYRYVHEDAAPEYPLHAQLERICDRDSVRCLVVLWPRRPSDALFVAEAARSVPCLTWVAQHTGVAALNEALRTLAARYAHAHAPSAASARRLLVHMAAHGLDLERDAADTLFRVFHSHAAVSDGVIAVLTRWAQQEVREGECEACVICAGRGEPVTVFTAGAHVTLAGPLCFACFQRSTVVRNAVFGTTPVFETNTTGATLFMLNQERVAYVLFRKRLFTYTEFVGAFNQAGIGMRLGAVHSRRKML